MKIKKVLPLVALFFFACLNKESDELNLARLVESFKKEGATSENLTRLDRLYQKSPDHRISASWALPKQLPFLKISGGKWLITVLEKQRKTSVL